MLTLLFALNPLNPISLSVMLIVLTSPKYSIVKSAESSVIGVSGIVSFASIVSFCIDSADIAILQKFNMLPADNTTAIIALVADLNKFVIFISSFSF